MTGSAVTERTQAHTTFLDVFAVGEYRALWLAQLVSIAGDQLARIALGVLVYDRTRSALLAAVTFAVTTGAMTIGALFLSWTADRYPRRAVMLVSDLACTALVLVMAVPGVPLAALIVLLFAVGLAIEPFLAARMALNREVLGKARFPLGLSVTLTTYQVAQLGGFAAGGAIVGFAGVRAALLIDAASFAASFLLIRFGVRRHPAPVRGGGPQVMTGLRLITASPAARTAMGLLLLAAFFAAPEGVMVPLARQYGGGPAAVGALFAASTAGAAIGMAGWTRMLAPARLIRLAAVLAALACAALILFALPLGLAGALAVLAVSALFAGYIPAASGVIMDAIPGEHRGKVSGLTGAGMSAGQGTGMIAAGALASWTTPSLALVTIGAAGTVLAVVLAGAWRKALPGTVQP